MNREKTADVAVWGRVPPPIGGMAVHLRRLLPHLTDAGISVQMYSVGRRTPTHPEVREVSDRRLVWFLGLLIGPCEPVHYVFSANVRAQFAASVLTFLRGTKVVLRIGWVNSLALAANSKNKIERWMVRFAIRNATVVVGVNEQICALAVDLGAKRVIHVPGFIPEAPGSERVPDEVDRFIEKGGRPVILAAGEIFDPQDDDLYGAYRLVDLLERIPSLRLVFYAYRVTLDSDPQERLAEEIRRRGLQDRYLLFRSAASLLPAMLRCDLMVRPTHFDGDSNSIREALHLGLPVIASDCVKRPEGVISFPTGDLDALQKTVLNVLGDLKGHRERVRLLSKPDHAKPIIDLFRELLGRS